MTVSSKDRDFTISLSSVPLSGSIFRIHIMAKEETWSFEWVIKSRILGTMTVGMGPTSNALSGMLAVVRILNQQCSDANPAKRHSGSLTRRPFWIIMKYPVVANAICLASSEGHSATPSTTLDKTKNMDLKCRLSPSLLCKTLVMMLKLPCLIKSWRN